MLKVLYINGKYAPVLICDYCGKRIDNANAGAAVNGNAPSEASKEGVLLDVKHAHKGNCHNKVEASMGELGTVGWTELSQHLSYLIRNTGLNPEEIQRIDKMLEEFDLS